MSRPKYIVFNVSDLEKFADAAAREYVVNMQNFIHQRKTAGKREKYDRDVAAERQLAQSMNRAPNPIPSPNVQEPLYFVLKLSDPFALRAIEHYITTASESSDFNGDNGLRAAVDHAITLKLKAVSFCEQKIPD